MTETKGTPAAANSTRAAPMGHHAAGGVAWALIQTGASKASGFVAQFFIAYLLDKNAIGAAFEAFAILAFPVVLQRFGVTDVLVQNQRRFRQFASAAFWISILAGFGVFIIGAGAAFALDFVHLHEFKPAGPAPSDPWLMTKLVAVCAIGYVIDGFLAVPQAKMRIDLRFNRMSMISFWSNLMSSSLTVIFILAHMGAMAIILPRTLVKFYELAAYWGSAGLKIRWSPDFRRWRNLLYNGGLLTLSLFFLSIVQNADNLLLGMIRGKEVLAVYGIGFNLSTQSLQVLAVSLTPTLFSVFSKLGGEPDRQAVAFIRSAEILTLVVAPFCVLQAAVAAPMLHFLYKSKWDEAIPVLQILSIGMCFAAMSGGITALLLAQGRYKLQMVWQLLNGMLFTLMVLASLAVGKEVAVSIAVLVFYILTSPLGTYIAARPAKVGYWKSVSLFLWPVLGSCIACMTPWLAMWVGAWIANALTIIPPLDISQRVLDLAACIVISVAGLLLYVILTVKLRINSVKLLIQYLGPLLGRLNRVPGAGMLISHLNSYDKITG